MNPFDLRGPEFLLFYVVLGAGVLGLLLFRRRLYEPQAGLVERLTDPARIAYLRSGPHEVLRLVTLALVERGLLQADGTVLETKKGADGKGLTKLERLVLRKFESPGEARSVFEDRRLARECDELRDSLASKGLVPDAAQRRLRTWSALAAVVLLAGGAGVKILVALSRGKSNVGFLVILAIAFSVAAFFVAHRPMRTPRGSAALADLRRLLEDARRRFSDTSAEAEFALLAAVFGAGNLPFHGRATRLKRLFPKASTSSSSCSGCGTGWAWSSGCGSSAGSSGGGCGGGGGGGCGGCGGD